MNRICIIACYFGELPEYFEIWKYSCKYNKDIDFLLVTDNDIEIKDKNIKVLNMKLEDLCNLAEKKLEMKISISNPYKLCDFKPVYGKILEDYINQYEFWGVCDIDQVFGRISDFLTDDILNKYDKIQNVGHLTIYRNNKKMRDLYKEDGAIYSYKYVFTQNENFAFDEYSGIDKIAEYNDVKTYNNIRIADIDVKYKRYKLCNYKNYMHQVFYWENGEIIRAYIENEKIKFDKFCYLHFQKKKPAINIKIEKELKEFYISEQGIIEKKRLGLPAKEELKTNAPYKGKKFEKNEEYQYIIKKIKQFLKCSIKQKKIWIKQKIYS